MIFSMRFIFCFYLLLLALTLPAHAQSNSDNFDLRAIGKNLADDKTDFYQRYVYRNETTVSKNADLSLPIIDQQEAKDWILQAVGSALTLSYSNYAERLEQIKPFFTEQGYQEYASQISQANLVNILKENQYSLVTVSRYGSTITGEGIDKNIYRWAFETPVMMSYINNQNDASFNMVITTEVIRVPFSKNDLGIAIDHWSLKPDNL